MVSSQPLRFSINIDLLILIGFPQQGITQEYIFLTFIPMNQEPFAYTVLQGFLYGLARRRALRCHRRLL